MEDLELKILELEERGYKVSEIANAIGKNVKFVYRHNSKAISEREKKKEANNRAEKEFEDLVREYLPLASSMNNLCSILGLRGVKGYYDKIQGIIDKYNLSTNHFGSNNALYNSYLNRKLDGNGRFIAMSDEEFFVKDSKRHGEAIIKRLIEGGYKEYKCEGENCGISEWNGKPLRLQVHHINGDHHDNRIENLQLLCPNCHTQTDTYGRNNIAKTSGFKITDRVNEILNGSESSFKPIDIKELKERILPPKEKKYCQVCGKEIKGDGEKYCSYECTEKASRKYEVTEEQLIKDFKELKSFSAVGRKYGVSDNAIKKRSKKLGVYDEIRQYITPR
jgi:predicted nucleic acid-binding Zn ribbon protein